MSIERVCKYLVSNVNKPYFLAVGDLQYQGVKGKLSEFGLKTLRVSDYCRNDDKMPDIDGLLEQLKAPDLNLSENKFVVIGDRKSVV